MYYESEGRKYEELLGGQPGPAVHNPGRSLGALVTNLTFKLAPQRAEHGRAAVKRSGKEL